MIFDEEKTRDLVIQWQETGDDALMASIISETKGLIEVIVSSYDSLYRDDMIHVKRCRASLLQPSPALPK